MTLAEGCKVCVKEDVLAGYTVEFRKKLTGRTGVVKRLFVPFGRTRLTARILWLKRGNRGREFSDIEYADNLEIVG